MPNIESNLTQPSGSHFTIEKLGPYPYAVVHNIADITGNGTTVPLVAAGVRTAANWVQIVAGSANASDVRFGDSTTSATSGSRIPPGAGQMFPATGSAEALNLADCWLFIANADTVSVIYGKT